MDPIYNQVLERRAGMSDREQTVELRGRGRLVAPVVIVPTQSELRRGSVTATSLISGGLVLLGVASWGIAHDAHDEATIGLGVGIAGLGVWVVSIGFTYLRAVLEKRALLKELRAQGLVD